MKLSMKSRYGLRALIDLSVNSKNEQVALGSIAERNNISPQYLEQVFASLRKAGIVKSIKGSQGGYFLNKPAEQITISEVIEALEGDYRIEAEDVPEDCDYKAAPEAIQKLVIDKVNYELEKILTGITLYDLEKEYQKTFPSLDMMVSHFPDTAYPALQLYNRTQHSSLKRELT